MHGRTSVKKVNALTPVGAESLQPVVKTMQSSEDVLCGSIWSPA